MVAQNQGSVVLFWVPTLKEAVPPPPPLLLPPQGEGYPILQTPPTFFVNETQQVFTQQNVQIGLTKVGRGLCRGEGNNNVFWWDHSGRQSACSVSAVFAISGFIKTLFHTLGQSAGLLSLPFTGERLVKVADNRGDKGERLVGD